MNWSFSAGRSFAGCPRRWFYRQVVAHHAAKDPARREAYLLSKLDSLWSWRGRLVDDLISREVVPQLAAGGLLEPAPLLARARARFDAQLAFAAAHRLRDAGMRPSQHPDFLALREVEGGAPPSNADLHRAWADIERALTNLFGMTELLGRLRGAAQLLPQRPLGFRRRLPGGESVTVRAVPDLLAFFNDAPLLIIDWKVHRHPTGDAREQLAGYALALVRASGQRGLPKLRGVSVADIDLLEVQLLADERRPYAVTAADVAALEANLVASATAMRALVQGRAAGDRSPYTVPTTVDLRVCGGCPFQGPCWDGVPEPRSEGPTADR